MRHFFRPRLYSVLAILALAASLPTLTGTLGTAADNDAELAALTAADDARVAAMLAADGDALEALLSDELHYAHSNGTVDTKIYFIEMLRSSRMRYLGYAHIERDFSFPAPGIALMTGRAQIQAQDLEIEIDATLSYLAVWRFEEGEWRFLAWQSCRIPAETR
jgi:hypothetical protein